MTPDFWHDRWRSGQIGFHRDAVHPDLIHHAPALLGDGPRRVLVPLCGKSLDLGWLVGQGHEVVGVELSAEAARQYHERAGITPQVSGSGSHETWRSPGLTYIVGDFFTADIGPVDAIWDRAALIALPPDMRPAYTARLRALLRPDGRMLLSCLTYDIQREGPPHSLTDDEVRAHYEHAGRLTLLASEDILDAEPRWQAAGMRVLHEKLWLLERGAKA